jgi:hypothetical protein
MYSMGCVPLLPLGRHAGAGAGYHERRFRKARRCFDDDPAALAVTEEPDLPADLGPHTLEAANGVGCLLDDRRLLPSTRRASHSSLVEGRDRDPRCQQVLPDPREVDVVVTIRRSRAGMHQHGSDRLTRGMPERARKLDVSVSGDHLHRCSIDH